MGSVQKIKVGINGFGRIGRLVASEKPVRIVGVKSSEESGIFNGKDNSPAQSKVINGKTSSSQSVASTWKIVHGPSMKGRRGGQVASFCTVPGNAEISKDVGNLQPALDGVEIKNDIKDGAGLYNNLFVQDAQENYIGQLRKKCWNLVGKNEKMMELVEKCLAKAGPEGLAKEMETIIHIILRSKSVPYSCNTYLNEVKKMRTLVSNSTNTKTSVESVKLRSIYQSASMIAQDICTQLRNKVQFRVIFGKIIREIPIEMKNGVEGIRVAVSDRINGAEIARTECGKYGKTSRTVFSQKVDYACAEALTRSGLIGI